MKSGKGQWKQDLLKEVCQAQGKEAVDSNRLIPQDLLKEVTKNSTSKMWIPASYQSTFPGLVTKMFHLMLSLFDFDPLLYFATDFNSLLVLDRFYTTHSIFSPNVHGKMPTKHWRWTCGPDVAWKKKSRGGNYKTGPMYCVSVQFDPLN